MEREDKLLHPPKDRIIEAITSGRRKEAIEAIEGFVKESEKTHDRLLDLTLVLLTYIQERIGEEAVGEAQKTIYDIIYKPMVDASRAMAAKELLQLFAQTHWSHFSDFSVQEDNEKWVLLLKCCGSGGRQRRDGKLDNTHRHRTMGGTTKKAYPWSFGEEGISYYCCHCSVMNIGFAEAGIDNRVKFEYGRQFDDDGNPVDEVCKWIVYKDRDR